MPPQTETSLPRANYGLDAPVVVRTMALIGLSFVVFGLVLRTASDASRVRLGTTLLWPGGSLLGTAVLMVLSSRLGKLRARDRLLDRLQFAGSETVLDVGCGHGLLLIGAARRLPNGHAIGVDLWSQVDQYANSADATMANATAEGVADRVTVKSGDMRELPIDDASIDAVVSSLAVHNVPSSADRARAIREMVRVLKPGGRVAILDIANVSAYAATLRDAGCVIEHTGFCPWIFPPTRELVARVPLSS